MQNKIRLSFRRNNLLVIAFLILITSLFVFALVVSYQLTRKFVDNEFEAGRVEVLERSIAPYNDFANNRVPEVSFYQGFLDSVSAKKYAEDILSKFPFVKKVMFFDNNISQEYLNNGFKFKNLFLSPKSIYRYELDNPEDSILVYKADRDGPSGALLADEDFNRMAVKFGTFLASVDTTKSISNDEIYNTFYSVLPSKITYMTLPGREEIVQFKKILNGLAEKDAVYEQDVVSYYLDPTELVLSNNRPELYQQIKIQSIFYYEALREDEVSTEISLPGALSEYKIYFTSSLGFLKKEIHNRFLPVAGGILFIYIILLIVAYLIYRNLNINLRMFKLQYDFVNNLSHEFKTPVSVIKIAGNNIKNAKILSEKEKDFYGTILEEESDKLNNLLNTLLSFTQIENKVVKPKKEEIDLNDFCLNMVNSYRIKYPDFDIQYSIKGIDTFKSDSTLLTSVFQNLIDNAYRYSYPGKKFMRISIYSQSQQIFFKFEDKGIGIARSEKDNIFKKFYRIQSEFNQQGSVGIGLAFSKEAIKLLKGNLAVESELGVGTTFTIVLPFNE